MHRSVGRFSVICLSMPQRYFAMLYMFCHCFLTMSICEHSFCLSLFFFYPFLWNVECWSDVESTTFYPAFAWTLFSAIVHVHEKIPTFIEQRKIKRIPTGNTMEAVSEQHTAYLFKHTHTHAHSMTHQDIHISESFIIHNQ